MSVNKFGMTLRKRESETPWRARATIESLRGHVRENALCLNDDSYDARERKIRRLAAPEVETDAVNASFVRNALANLKLDYLRQQLEISLKNVNDRFDRHEETSNASIESLKRNLLAKEVSQSGRISRAEIDVEAIRARLIELTEETGRLSSSLNEATKTFRGDLSDLANRRDESDKMRDDRIGRLEEKVNALVTTGIEAKKLTALTRRTERFVTNANIAIDNVKKDVNTTIENLTKRIDDLQRGVTAFAESGAKRA